MKQKIIPLGKDMLFKKVFGDNNAIERLEGFISVYFNAPIEEVKGKVKVVNGEKRKQHKDSKEQRVDIVCEVNLQIKDIIVNIEVNLKEGTTLKRNVLYASGILSNQLRNKQSYDEIKPVIQISFDNYEINEENERIIKRCFIKDEEGKIVTDILEIDHINIDKCNEVWYNNGINKYEKRDQDLIRIGALLTIDNIEDFKSCMEEISMSKEIKEEIVDAVEEFNGVEDFVANFDYEEDRRKIIEGDLRLAKRQAREEGLQEGREEGIKKGIKEGKIEGAKKKSIDIVKRLLLKNIDVNIISETTGLTLEEIKKLES